MTNTTITAQIVADSVKSDSTDSLRSIYLSADVSGKAKIRKVATDAMFQAVSELDGESANKIRLFLESLKSVSSHKVEIDPKAQYAEFVASVCAFYAQVADGQFVPEGIELDETDKQDVRLATVENWSDQFNSDIVDKFRKVRVTRASGRSVTDHLKEVFSDLPVGTFLTCTQVANRTSEAYGTDHPSSGAVAAVRPAAMPEGLEKVESDKSHGIKAGIRKVA